MKYRKKPVVIEAIKLEKTNIRKAYLFCHPNEPQQFNGTRQEFERWDNYEDLVVKQGGLKIETNEGVMLAAFGDYIIKEPLPTNDRLFYPCKPDIFEKTYEVLVEIDLENKRKCSHCGEEMSEGYCINGGEEYYCSDDCLHANITQEEYLELYDEGNGDSYYTEWEE